MSIDATSLVLQVNSTGISEATEMLNALAAAGANVEANVANMVTGTVKSTKANEESSTSVEKLLSKFQQQVALLGATTSEKMRYIAQTKKATEEQMAQASSLGEQVDAFKRMAASEKAAASQTSEVTRQQKELTTELGRVQVAANKMNAEWERGKAINAAGWRQKELADIKATDKALQDAVNSATTMGKKGEEGMNRFGLGTVGAKREVIVLAHEMISGNWSRIPGSLMVLGERTDALGKVIGFLKSPIGIAALALGALIAVTATMVFHSEQLARSLNGLENNLEATGRGMLISKDGLTSLMKEMERLPGITKDGAKEVLATFAQTHQIGGAMFKNLALLTADFAAAIGKDAPEAAKKLAAAFKDPAKGAVALDKELGTLKAGTILLIEQMARNGNVAGANQLLFDTLKDKVHGLANNQTDLQHATSEVTKSWDGLTASMGKSSGMASVNNLLVGIVNKFAWIVAHSGEIAKAMFPLTATAVEFAVGSFTDTKPRRSGGGKIKGVDSAEEIAKATTAQELNTKAVIAAASAYESENSVLAKKKELRKRLTEELVLHTGATKEDIAVIAKLKSELGGLDEDMRKADKGKSAAIADKYHADLTGIQGDIESAKRELADIKEKNETLFKKGSISRLQQIKLDGEAAIIMYDKEAASYEKMLKLAAPKNKMAVKAAIGNKETAAEENSSGERVTIARNTEVELAKMDASNTERHAKELEKRGAFDQAYALRSEHLDKTKVATATADYEDAVKELAASSPMSHAFDEAISKVNILKENLRVMKADSSDNQSKAAYETAKAKFDALVLQMRVGIAKVRADAMASGGLFAGIAAEEKADQMRKDFTPALEAAGEKMLVLAANGQDAAGQLTTVTKAMADLKKETEAADATNGLKGAQAALTAYGKSAEETGTQINHAMTGAFKSAEDALTTFLSTGKLSFKGFVTSIIADLARIEAQKMLSSITKGIGGSDWMGSLAKIFTGGGGAGDYGTGSTGSIAGSSADFSVLDSIGAAAGAAGGGYRTPNSMGEVNEKGPEMLTQGGRDYLMTGSQGGHITPADKIGGNTITLTSAPIITIDARSDQAQVRQIVDQSVQQANAKLVDTLHRQRRI